MTNDNPYIAPAAENSAVPLSETAPKSIRIGRCLFLTSLLAVVLSIPLAGVIGLLFRFPIPFAGYASGPEAFLSAMVAAIFYGIIGGAAVQATMGCIGGVFVYRLAQKHPDRFGLLALLGGAAGALPGLLILATLDWMIGPW